MLGAGGRSYVVGYGSNPPSHEHHRGASCPQAPASCGWNYFNLGSPNVNTLFGALVGGPSASDGYRDLRSDFMRNEVALDYNAGFTGGHRFCVMLASSQEACNGVDGAAS